MSRSSWKSERQKLSGKPRTELNLQVCVDEPKGEALAEAQIAYEKERAHAMQRLARSIGDESVTRDSIKEAVDIDDAVVAARRAVDEAEAEYTKTLVDLTFRALPSHEYEALRAQHPDPAGESDFDMESFGPALVAASHVYYEKDEDTGQHVLDQHGNRVEGPGMEDAAEARALLADMSQADRVSTIETALAVNVTPQVNLVALGKG